MNPRPSRLATAPVVPVPQKGSRITSPGREDARITRASSASGFCVGGNFLPAPSLSLSSPVPNANVQSERMRVGEAPPAEVRDGIGFAPYDVVENPKSQILEERADAKDVVVGADHPQRGAAFHHAAAGDQPCPGKLVIRRKARESIPFVIDGIDSRIIGAS